ncbi:hypothetical protein GCM10010269_77550 [Streptomyces humidus]|uniref:Uncharacterized protein n=1 Tax=Streptomyces humidus TaxID=52259 RepID=A0A918GAJ3_9ACTN|nr:hypothetical protein GCM10010269_77550 [Streptomyces humidus]
MADPAGELGPEHGRALAEFGTEALSADFQVDAGRAAELGEADELTTSPGFWCECWTQGLDERRPPALFGSFDAYSAVEANNWVATILRTISPALDTAASQEAWTRLHDDRIDTRRALLRREPWTVSITHVSTRIT